MTNFQLYLIKVIKMGLFDRFKKTDKKDSGKTGNYDSKSCEYAKQFKSIIENGPGPVLGDISEGQAATFQLMQVFKKWQAECEMDSNQFMAFSIIGFMSGQMKTGSSTKSDLIAQAKKKGCSCPELEKFFIEKIEILYDSGLF